MREELIVTIYSKNDCPLCEEAEEVLVEVQSRLGFRLLKVDIYSDGDLYERYKHDIPVIAIGEVEAFRHRVAPGEFEREWRRRCGG